MKSVAAVLILFLSFVGTLLAQYNPPFSRKNTYTVFAEYSNDSSTIIVGQARQRKLADLGASYTRRVVRFLGSDLGYHIELRPVLFESDPLTLVTDSVTQTTGTLAGTTNVYYSSYVQTRCLPVTISGTVDPSSYGPGETYTSTATCGRQWTFGQSFAPIGFKYSMRTQHPLQPFIIGTLGYMYTSRPVPLAQAESFNFVIAAGAGVEVYRSKKRSVSVEARVQHFSNRNTAAENPGTDNLMFKVSYSFGR
jgi:hypothetical protein